MRCVAIYRVVRNEVIEERRECTVVARVINDRVLLIIPSDGEEGFTWRWVDEVDMGRDPVGRSIQPAPLGWFEVIMAPLIDGRTLYVDGNMGSPVVKVLDEEYAGLFMRALMAMPYEVVEY